MDFCRRHGVGSTGDRADASGSSSARSARLIGRMPGDDRFSFILSIRVEMLRNVLYEPPEPLPRVAVAEQQ